MLWEFVKLQRDLTIDFIEKRRLRAPFCWLKSGGIHLEHTKIATDPREWEREDNEFNAGVQLVDGYLELQITAPDDVWAQCLFQACRHLKVDARAAYGPANSHVTGILIRIRNERTIDRWRDLWPRWFADRAGKRVETTFEYTILATPRSKPDNRYSHPLPGSQLLGNLIVWRPMGKKAADEFSIGVEDLEPRELASTDMEYVCRAIAYATLIYWIRISLDGCPDWDQSMIRIIGGWLARLAIKDGPSINAPGKSLEDICWCPIDNESAAADLIAFLKAETGASAELEVWFNRCAKALERNSEAKIPGWPSLEEILGIPARIAIRRAFRTGEDIDFIETLRERYVHDRSSHEYLDREALLAGLKFNHSLTEMIETFQNDTVKIKKKFYNKFRLYAQAALRMDVNTHDFFPGEEPAAIIRFSPVHGVVNGDNQYADEYQILNTFPGFVIKQIETINQVIMAEVVELMDHFFGLLTRHSTERTLWLKKWIAWILKFPHIKQQICPVLIGGQGIGKSRFGLNLMTSLFGNMAGSAVGDALADNKFMITPFLDKLVVFIDETKFDSIGAINNIKRLVREDRISGQRKFKDQRDYYVPARLILASNQADIGLTPEDAADRALFFIMSYTAENMGKTADEFLAWSNSHKPFYNQLVRALERVDFKQHLMRYFRDIEVEREELEDLTHSSRDDESVVLAAMTKPRRIARDIIASAHVSHKRDITAWFTEAELREAIRREDGSKFSKIDPLEVIREYERANVIKREHHGYYRFRYRYGTLLEKMGEANRLKLEPRHPTVPGEDFGDNPILTSGHYHDWRGLKKAQPKPESQPTRGPWNRDDPPDSDPDDMPPF